MPLVCHVVDIMVDRMVRFKCATKLGYTVCGTCGAPMPIQRARVSSVEKTQSFSFFQVDMYDVGT